MTEDTINLLRDLIAIDSVNPTLVSGAAGEGEIARGIAARLRRAGIDVEVQPAGNGRSNVIGVIEGARNGRSLMLCGHMDTVGVAGMNAPFDPVLKDGRVYGRGSQDMKGGLASMIGAVIDLAANGRLKKGRVIFAAVVDEEDASIGAEALVAKWNADLAIVGEPTDMQIAIGHKGFEWVEIVTEGIAAHGSRPADGRDAIMAMGRVLSRLERLSADLQSRKPHSILGVPSLHASLIDGGREMSTYPDRCVLKMERRTVDTDPERSGLNEVQNILQELSRQDPQFRGNAKPLISRPHYLSPFGEESDAVKILSQALHRRHIQPVLAGMSFWTDAAILASGKTPSLIFGPRGAGLHSVEEYVLAEDVLTCRDILVELAEEFC
jgi:acetylornithine deacetylase